MFPVKENCFGIGIDRTLMYVLLDGVVSSVGAGSSSMFPNMLSSSSPSATTSLAVRGVSFAVVSAPAMEDGVAASEFALFVGEWVSKAVCRSLASTKLISRFNLRTLNSASDGQ